MKRRIAVIITVAATATLHASAQNTGSGASSSAAPGAGTSQTQPSSTAGQNNAANPSPGTLPPGLENREQLPPGFQNREQLPPGLAKRTNQAGTSVATNAAGTSAQFRNGSAISNQFGTLSNRTGLSATGNAGSSNRVFGGSISNRTNVRFQDQAVTQVDERLLVRVRQTVVPRLQRVGAWSPACHFRIENGVVTLIGFVVSIEISQEIEAAVVQVPGVVRVINQLVVNREAASSTGVGVEGSTRLGVSQTSTNNLNAGAGFAATNSSSASTNLASTGRANQQLPPGLSKPSDQPANPSGTNNP